MKKNTRHPRWRIAALSLGLAFLLLNLLAFIHAWRFTHFSAEGTRIKQPQQMSMWQKAGVVFGGLPNPRPQNTKEPALPFSEIWFDAEQQLSGWFIPNDTARDHILLFHGYGGCRSGLLEQAYRLHALGFNVWLADFRGSGASAGNKTSIGYYEAEDVKTARDHVQNRLSENAHLYLFGTSMGAAAIMRAEALYGPLAQGLILECPFPGMRSAVQQRFRLMHMPTFLLPDLLTFWGGVQQGFNAFAHNPLSYAKKIQSPVLLIHGKQDNRVSTEDTERIYQNLAGPRQKLILETAGHENMAQKEPENWTKAIAQFTKEAGYR